MSSTHLSDEDRLRQRLAGTRLRGRPIGSSTAHQLASWLAEAIGPGFERFLTTGDVTAALYSELARLYDLRHPEVEHWLDTLTRYVLQQPVEPTPRPSVVPPEDR